MKGSEPFPPRGRMRARQGAECVYWDKGYIIHAVLEEVQLDEWGVRLKFRNLDSPGFIGADLPLVENEIWTADARWDVFAYSDNLWWAGCVSWSVYFSPGLIGALREAARGLDGADRRSRYAALHDCLDHHPDQWPRLLP